MQIAYSFVIVKRDREQRYQSPTIQRLTVHMIGLALDISKKDIAKYFKSLDLVATDRPIEAEPILITFVYKNVQVVSSKLDKLAQMSTLNTEQTSAALEDVASTINSGFNNRVNTNTSMPNFTGEAYVSFEDADQTEAVLKAVGPLARYRFVNRFFDFIPDRRQCK